MQINPRYMMFYAILAVGLAFSWSQVGKRAQLVAQRPVYVMSTEEDCRPWQLPCAAYARDFALVLGPADSGLLLVGQKLPPDAELSVQHFDDRGGEPTLPLLRALPAGRWSIEGVSRDGRLRVNLLDERQQWSAEFPLR